MVGRRPLRGLVLPYRETPASGSELKGARVALVLVAIGVLAAAPGIVWYFFLRGERGSKAEIARAASIAAQHKEAAANRQYSDGAREHATPDIARPSPRAPAARRRQYRRRAARCRSHRPAGR